jgi:hypothetical protein
MLQSTNVTLSGVEVSEVKKIPDLSKARDLNNMF